MKSIIHLNCVILDSQGGGGVESFQINGASLKNGNLTCAFVCAQKSACDILICEYSYSRGKTVIEEFSISTFPCVEIRNVEF